MSVSNVSNQLASSYEKLSSMKQINRAADNAAGLAIVNKMQSQTNGYDVGTRNALTGQDLLKTADGALGSMADSLQRIRELSIQSLNGIYTDEDRSYLQEEVNGLLSDIQGVARNTEFNTLKLLDGSMADLHLATNPDGTGMKIQMENATLQALGIDGYDVTKLHLLDGEQLKAAFGKIDGALSKVSSARSSLGASSNAIDHVVSYNRLASENLTAASSRIEDLDVAQEVSKLKKNEILQQYQLFAQKAKQQAEARKAGMLNFA